MKLTPLVLFAFLTVTGGCGSETSEDDDAPDTLGRERLPIPTRYTELDRKYDALPAAISDGYYAQALQEKEGHDSIGSPFKFYSGPLGRGAIYVPITGAVAIYGAVLEEWARSGYETAPLMGYPISDEVGGRQEFATEQTVPSVENNGLAEIHHYLVEDGHGRATHVFQSLYRDTINNVLSPEPQKCWLIDSIIEPGTFYAELFGAGWFQTLHCGVRPQVDPNAPSSGAYPENI